MKRLICRLRGHQWAVEWRYGRDSVVVGVDSAVCLRCRETFI